jgi:glutamate N-acetyltransferase/amino-acid N-acetyltransferase
MTTDTVIKKTSTKLKTKNGEIIIWGCVKGSGMIYPDLKNLHATMLSFILTDAAIDTNRLQKILDKSVEQSFNCVSVDGDTSTNDTVIVLANGQSQTGKLSTKDLATFTKSFDALTLELAKSIAKDGEGATKFIEIEVKNAKSQNDAKAIAQTIATSPLVKTAIFGSDANWGRILAAAGRAKINFDFTKTDIKIANILTFKKGSPINFDETLAKKSLQKKEIKITLNLHAGTKSSKYYTCDLTHDYIKINADYRS